MADIVLDSFNTELQIESALTNCNTFVLNGVDACAVYEMSINLIRSMFKYNTDPEDDFCSIRYYTHYRPEFYFNPADAKLNHPKSFGAIATANSNGVYASELMTIKYDYVRYLALKLFNTITAVDLFLNLEDLLDDISYKINNAMEQNVNLIKDCDSIYGLNPGLMNDEEMSVIFDYVCNEFVTVYAKYLDDMANQNICKELFLQLLQFDTERFNVPNTGPRSLPFVCGDTINFKIRVNAATNQHILTDVDPILPRTYHIKIVLVDIVIPVITVPCQIKKRRKKKVAYAYNPTEKPTIIFKDINNLPIDYYDFVLFRYYIEIRDILSNTNGTLQIKYRYISGLLQIYPKAFTGLISSIPCELVSLSKRFVFSNEINYMTDYQNTVSHGQYGRMFYLQNTKDFDSNIHVIITKDGEFAFDMIQADNQEACINIELLNPGKLTFDAISTKYFDLNIL